MARPARRGGRRSAFWRVALLGALAGALCLGCGGNGSARTPVVVASADTPEQIVLGKITVLALRRAGFTVVDKTALGSPFRVRKALEGRAVDIYWDYMDDTWTLYLGRDQPIANPAELYRRVRDQDALNQVTWLPMAPRQRAPGLAMLRSRAEAVGVTSLADLATYSRSATPKLALCTPRRWHETATGMRGLAQAYGLQWDQTRVSYGDVQEGYQALAQGRCDCAFAYANDAPVVAGELVFLPDVKEALARAPLAVAVRSPVLEALPDLERPLYELSAVLTDANLDALLRQVVVEGAKPDKVAQRFLREHKLPGGNR